MERTGPSSATLLGGAHDVEEGSSPTNGTRSAGAKPDLAADSGSSVTKELTDGHFDLQHYKQQYWKQFCDEERPNVLGDNGLCIARDGGISDLDELEYSMQYFYAGLLIAFCLANIYMISLADLTAILQHPDEKTAEASRKFLLSKMICTWLFPGGARFRLEIVIPFFELLYLYWLVFKICWRCVKVTMSASYPSIYGVSDVKERELERWSDVSNICWDYMPKLSCCSAMRLLYYVTPSVLGTELFIKIQECTLHWETARKQDLSRRCTTKVCAIWHMVSYLAFCAFCLIIGFDAFLVKYRMAAGFIEKNVCTFSNMLGTAIFLFQVLGVVNLNWFVRQRLFIFIFGGEDGAVDNEEKARWEVWNALLAKEIFKKFGFFKGAVVMLGFDDYDFQSLALDDHGKAEKMQKKKTGIPQEHFHRTLVRGSTAGIVHELDELQVARNESLKAASKPPSGKHTTAEAVHEQAPCPIPVASHEASLDVAQPDSASTQPPPSTTLEVSPAVASVLRRVASGDLRLRVPLSELRLPSRPNGTLSPIISSPRSMAWSPRGEGGVSPDHSSRAWADAETRQAVHELEAMAKRLAEIGIGSPARGGTSRQQ